MRLPVNTVIHTTLVGLEPATFRSLVRRATSSATEPTEIMAQIHTSCQKSASLPSHIKGGEDPGCQNWGIGSFVWPPRNYKCKSNQINNINWVKCKKKLSIGLFILKKRLNTSRISVTKKLRQCQENLKSYQPGRAYTTRQSPSTHTIPHHHHRHRHRVYGPLATADRQRWQWRGIDSLM